MNLIDLTLFHLAALDPLNRISVLQLESVSKQCAHLYPLKQGASAR